LSCCLSIQSKDSCCYCHDAIECENCCRVMKGKNTCGGVSGQQTVPSPYLHFTLYFYHSPAPIKKQENSWSKIAKIQATNNGRGVRNAARRTGISAHSFPDPPVVPDYVSCHLECCA